MSNIDFDHWLGSQIGNTILENAEQERYLQLIKNLQPEFGKDGNQFYYLYGKDLQEGIAGFGDTPALAMQDLHKNFYNEKA